MPSAPVPSGPLDQYRDLFQVYDELALDNRHQLQRTLDRLPEGTDPVTRLRAVIDVLVGEIAHLKADLSHLRLEVLAHGIPSPPLALWEERVVGNPPRCLDIDMAGVFAGNGWTAPERRAGNGLAFRRVHPDAGHGMIELALDRAVPLHAEWVLAGYEPASGEDDGAALWVDGAPAGIRREDGPDGEVRLVFSLPAHVPGSNRLTRLTLAFSGGVQRLRVYPS